jgi:hypothetical protein
MGAERVRDPRAVRRICVDRRVGVRSFLIFFLHVRSYQRAYLKQFPPVNGVPLDMYVGGNPFSPESCAVWSAMWNRQPNPDLERMRRQYWRRYRRLMLWMLGFPVLAIGVAALLMLTVFPH